MPRTWWPMETASFTRWKLLGCFLVSPHETLFLARLKNLKGWPRALFHNKTQPNQMKTQNNMISFQAISSGLCITTSRFSSIENSEKATASHYATCSKTTVFKVWVQNTCHRRLSNLSEEPPARSAEALQAKIPWLAQLTGLTPLTTARLFSFLRSTRVTPPDTLSESGEIGQRERGYDAKAGILLPPKTLRYDA